MKQRLAPFLVLLEARYAPLLFAVAPQSYAVYLWLWQGSDRASASFWFAVAGALGYELVYVGAIAWAEEGRSSFWTWATAGVALVFSVVVAFYVYRSQGAWAWLHAGFPLVAFTYTLNMHSKRSVVALPGTAQIALEALPERLGATGATEADSGAPPTIQAVNQAPALSNGRRGVAPLEIPPSGATYPPDGQAAWLDELLNRPSAEPDWLSDLTNPSTEPSASLEAVVIEQAPRYTCPHCGQALASKQALGAAVKNGYCLGCKERRG